MILEMNYLPYKSIVHRLATWRPKLVVPEHLSSVGWPHGFRVKIIPSQTFCHFDGLSDRHTTSLQKQLDFQVNCRQHLMPHNGQLATTIQTLVGEINGVGEWRESEMETLTYISTSEVGLYHTYYVHYRQDGGVGKHGRIGVGDGVVFSANIIEPRPLRIIQSTLLSSLRDGDSCDGRGGGGGKKPLITAIYRPMFFSGYRFFT